MSRRFVVALIALAGTLVPTLSAQQPARQRFASVGSELAGELREQLVKQGSIFQSSSDTEVVLHLYAKSTAGTVEDAVVESVSQVQGAFSFLMLTRDRLIAVRDPHGFRPLALGRLDEAYVVCSETCAMDLIGATYVRDVEPLEWPDPLLLLGAEEEVAPHGHERDHREVLVDGGDAAVEGFAR